LFLIVLESVAIKEKNKAMLKREQKTNLPDNLEARLDPTLERVLGSGKEKNLIEQAIRNRELRSLKSSVEQLQRFATYLIESDSEILLAAGVDLDVAYGIDLFAATVTFDRATNVITVDRDFSLWSSKKLMLCNYM
jgi:hypothetical protein